MKKIMKNKKNKKGFTLIELIVVMAVIGILVLLAAPKFLGYTKDANVTAMQADAKILSNAALMYNIDNEKFPLAYVDTDANGKMNGAEVLTAAPAVATGLKDYLVSHGAGSTAGTDAVLGNADDVLTATVASIQAVDLTTYIKNTKNPIANYVIVTSGPMQGDVVSAAGVQDKAGKLQFGIAK